MNAYKFLESKIGHFNPSHPFNEININYEDVLLWLDEYRKLNMCNRNEREALLITFLLFIDKKDTYYKKTTDEITKVMDFLKSINSK